MSLSTRHPTLFFKRLRKRSGKARIRYFLAAEYGGKTERPHYHAIIFNARIEDIEKSWQYGAIHAGQVSEASVGYTLKYMMKKGQIPMHKNDDRIPEFQRMSKGLGENYLTPAIREWHESDMYNRMYIPVQNKKIAMPRYYKLKLYTPEQLQHIGEYLSTKVEKPELSGKEEINRFEFYENKKRISRLKEVL